MECQTGQEYYYSYIEKDFQAIPPERLEHLRACPACLEQIAQLEQMVTSEAESDPLTHQNLALHFRLLNQWVDCDRVKPFLPVLAMKSLPVYVETPVTAHIARCPMCRADRDRLLAITLTPAQWIGAVRVFATDTEPGKEFSQQANEVLDAIRRRSVSGIMTRAVLSDQGGAPALQVETATSGARCTGARSRRVFNLAASGLAAAMVVIAAILFIQPPSARALDLQQFYDSLAAVQNLSIRTIIPEEDVPMQQVWVSLDRGLAFFDSPERAVLVDMNTKKMVTRDKPLALTRLQPADFVVPDFLQLPWGLLPFRDITQLPDGVKWKRIDTQVEDKIVVYELSWTDALASGRCIDRKWRGSLRRNTHLPEKIEWYERLDDQMSYTLRMTMEISYPKTREVLEAVQGAGLELSYGDQR